jgi:hypothetical protein
MSHIFRILTPWRGSVLNYTPVGDNVLWVGTSTIAHLSIFIKKSFKVEQNELG